MSNTVHSAAATLRAVPQLPADEPRTWTFTNRETGEPTTVTCMLGCTLDHAQDIATPTHPEDISCQADGPELHLPVMGSLCESGRTENLSVLGFRLQVNPFAPTLAERLPHLLVEVVDEQWIEGLDPDTLAMVIGQLQSQLERLRVAQVQLGAARDEYRRRSA
ncbi:DUF6907 domain-containing protein [Streptomyces djakartensis]|uniref:Uncharacterized protein n=1 Tax=Streptomyces djakartensis TaxID=68193 RepID=A0ABQ2ZVS8_9ACTN|nr:hypothetical protein [Streptomyces djakartensis]GGY27479.1 hypothetical protein GCM10010384_38230 [Streptomyces djakartensis]